jgi:hypothetical protein
MHDELNAMDESIELEETTSTVAVMEPECEVTECEPAYTGPCCEKCNTPVKSDVVAICRRCGWYASLGTFVELDQNWEKYSDEASEPVEAAPQKSHLRVWLDLVPRWGWIILASVMVVVVESVVARFVTPAGSSLRTAWSLTQLLLGVIAVIGCHIFNFVVLAADDADFGVADMFVKPLKLWIRAVHRLPTRLWVANTAACGLVAALMSLIVIGGIPYERLWDWGFEEPVKQDLMGAVMDRAKELDSRNDGELDEAIGDFAGSQNTDGAGDLPKATPPKPRDKTDCVILGYEVDREGRLSSLVLGAVHKSELIYAGRVTPELSAEENAELLGALAAAKTLQPFITMETDATFVKPQFTCRVTYGERLKSGQLREVKWERLIGTVKMKERLMP